MGSKLRRVYDAAQTPLGRVLACAQAKKEQVAELKHSGSLWIGLRIPRKMHNAACETALEAGAASPSRLAGCATQCVSRAILASVLLARSRRKFSFVENGDQPFAVLLRHHPIEKAFAEREVDV
jgi:hypothetical protein